MPLWPKGRSLPPRSWFKEALADTPLSLWLLADIAAGTVAHDHMQLHNGVYTGDGITRNQAGPGIGTDWAVGLAGTDDGIQVGDFADYEFTGDFTAEAWCFQTVSADAILIAKRQGPTTGEWSLSLTAAGALVGVVANTINTNFLVASGGVVALNRWHHAAMTISGTTITAYLDGVSVASSSSTTGTRRTSSADGLAIGFNGNGIADELTGLMAPVALYTSALSPARIAAHYAGGVV